MKNISVIEPISQSISWVKFVLFENFNLGKWFTIGFTAFLAALGDGGGGGGINNISNLSNKNHDYLQLKSFFVEHIVLISICGLAFFMICIAVGLLIQWLSSRGKFMFLDNVVRNRAEIKEVWRKFKPLANSFFKLQICLILISFAVFLLIVLISLLVAWSAITNKVFDTNAIISIILFVVLVLIMVISFTTINAVLKNFCLPIMYLRNVKILEAIKIFKLEIAPNHIWDIIRFFLMKFVLGLAIAAIAVLCCCITCCIVAIPYIGSVILLPLTMFMRCYSLFFLEQFGTEWTFFEKQQQEKIVCSL